MSLQELKEQAIALSADERLELISALTLSIRDASRSETWQFLELQPHSWRKQLYIKGRRLLASTVWGNMITNQLTLEQAVDNWDLPLAAIGEAIRYCKAHKELIVREAEAERQYSQAEGLLLEPKSAA